MEECVASALTGPNGCHARLADFFAGMGGTQTTSAVIDLISQMVELNPSKRITAVKALGHKCFQEARACSSSSSWILGVLSKSVVKAALGKAADQRSSARLGSTTCGAKRSFRACRTRCQGPMRSSTTGAWLRNTRRGQGRRVPDCWAQVCMMPFPRARCSFWCGFFDRYRGRRVSVTHVRSLCQRVLIHPVGNSRGQERS
jgi:hypothetical protein